MNKLYKANKKISQPKLFEHFTKLLYLSTINMYDDMKGFIGCRKKIDQTIKTR